MNKTCIFNFSRHFMDSVLPIRRDGRVWFKAAVLKTAVGQPTVGSNPTPSAILASNFFKKCRLVPFLIFKSLKTDYISHIRYF